ncbi:hypothetical protein COLO4_11308 [Corchorus olitorius]|uniref:Kinesin motor domain-containing protein n=1 Tax=Corchorus olitorius TaxID=93759 RepID=A0A1R3K4X1_9ROSI|nr:hypothetical protein COLO4_11308 [Corchorus olitorius]
MDELGLPRFEVSDLEKGPMKAVVNCLLTLRAQFLPSGCNLSTNSTKPGTIQGDSSSSGTFSPLSAEERRKASSESKFQQRALHNPLISESSAAALHPIGHKFHEVFQLKPGQGRYSDLPATKISEMMKSNSLDNAPTQSLLSVVNGILDESVERKNGEIPHRVACLLRKVVQEIERRISTQAEHLRTQNNLFKSREEKYQSRLRVLEALASGAGEETKTENSKVQEKQKVEEEKRKLMEEHGKISLEKELELQKFEEEKRKLMEEHGKISLEKELELQKFEEEKRKLMEEHGKRSLEKELELQKFEEEKRKLMEEHGKRSLEKELEIQKFEEEKRKLMEERDKRILEKELELQKVEEEKRKLMEENDKKILEKALEVKKLEEENRKLMKENDKNNLELTTLKQELEIAKKKHEQYCLEIESEAKGTKEGLQMRLKELESLLADSNNKVKELEADSDTICQRWNMKENIYKSYVDSQFRAMRELSTSSQSIKKEMLKTQKSYSEEFSNLGVKLKALTDAAENYRELLVENQKLFNELQDLKGNIRVYCRIRPFLPGQSGKQTIVDSIGDNGQLAIANPSKPGKEGLRSFKFNKIYGPTATQAEVFSDIQPFVQSVVDGYNVCIFAYGQTGSGKTYTMTGPNGASEEEWGVNYRAMNYLFKISQNRRSSIQYEVGVQMVEIYNEQPNGLAVPDASMNPVLSASDVLNLINIGFKNRAMSATALNERSSRSHSIVTIHVRGKDLKAGNTLYGNLHLVDLAGSERVDRSEVTGDRLKEAQHINKSLSSLGDVIFALAQKSPHVPYRNSKLTQVLQSSLGGQAKTLMFVQLNPDVTSYSESMSTLKFAERVSGVELGAARSSKDGGKDVRELMEQMASLKDTIAKKDEEIERLQLLKDLKNGYAGINDEQHGSDKHSEADSQQSMDEEKLTEISDAGLSVGTETDGSAEYPLSPESPSVGRTRVAARTRLTPLQKPAPGKIAGKPDSPRGIPKPDSPRSTPSIST